jgi:beta-lactamase regulating signal transducer with metallopeptidase domain
VVGLDAHSRALGRVELGYALEHELSHIARGDTRLAICVELALFHRASQRALVGL